MSSWWGNMETVAAVNGWLLAATLASSALTGVMAFLAHTRSNRRISQLAEDVDTSRKYLKSLEKTAEAIRKELLETQQHQDISQLKLKTSRTSAGELRQALLEARKRLEIAEAATQKVREQNAQKRRPEPAAEPPLPGGLSESQREQLIALLDPGPKGNVDIFCVMDDPKSYLTATHLNDVLTADGWKTSGVAQSVFSCPPQGVVLAVNNKETAPSYSSFLQRVLSTIGLAVSAKVDAKYREWSLTLIVGTELTDPITPSSN